MSYLDISCKRVERNVFYVKGWEKFTGQEFEGNCTLYEDKIDTSQLIFSGRVGGLSGACRKELLHKLKICLRKVQE